VKKLLFSLLALAIVVGPARTEEKAKTAPKVILKSPDGKKTIDLEKLTNEGPVLVRLTCACSGCDQELTYFKKIQAGYNAKGLKTIAVFREKPEAASNYAVKQGLEFFWLSDPKGEMWKTFDAKVMPTNILIGKGGKVLKVVSGCTKDGKNAQALSAEIAKALGTKEVNVREESKKKK
jgi:peroxiredoxin